MRNLILILKQLLGQLIAINAETRRIEAGQWRSALSLQQGKAMALHVMAKNIEQVALGHLEVFHEHGMYSLEDIAVRSEQLRLAMGKILTEVGIHEGLADQVKDDLIRG